jgi:hypothetical protein
MKRCRFGAYFSNEEQSPKQERVNAPAAQRHGDEFLCKHLTNTWLAVILPPRLREDR